MFNGNLGTMPIASTTTFIIYILCILGVGIYAARCTKNLSDYILGGRRLGSIVTGLSAGASDMSGWLLMGLPGALYVTGLCEGWIAIGLVIGAYFNWRLIAGRLRVYTEHSNNALTLPDYFISRFNDKHFLTSSVASLIILFFFVIYCASGMVASAKLFEQTFGLDYYNALYIGAASTIFYVFIGGFLAVSWTDAIQATLMIFALIIVPIIIVYQLGGFAETVNSLQNVSTLEGKGEYNNFLNGISAVSIISCLAWGLGYMGQPHILVRFMASSSVKAIPNARRISITWMILCLLGACAVGYTGRAYMNKFGLTIADPEKIFIFCSQELFSPWITGILLSAILSAIMSTLSCQLLVASSTLTEDFYKKYIRPKAKERELVWCGRLTLFLVSVIAFILATDKSSQVLGLVSYAWAGFGASFGPVVLISLFWSKMNKFGAFFGMLAGALTVVIWENTNPFDWGLYSLLPAFVVNVIVIYVVSYLTRNTENGKENIEFYYKLKTSYHKELSEDEFFPEKD